MSYPDLLKGVLQFPGVEYLQWQHDAIITGLVTEDIKAVHAEGRLSEAQAIATAPDLTPPEYNSLKDQRAKTTDERYAQHKHELQRRYPIPVTPELKIKDDEGWYAQLRLHYYLTHDPSFVRLRDLKEWEGHLDRGDGKIALQDVRLLTAQVETFNVLRILDFLNPERQVRATAPDVVQLRHQAVQYCHDIKVVLNLTISEKMTPIEVTQALLRKLGVKLTCVGRDVAANGRRGGVRVYQYQIPGDDRDTIFAQWQQRDTIAQANRLAEEIESAPATVSIARIDPPPDISVLNQAGSGLKEQKIEQGKALQSNAEGKRVKVLMPESAVADDREEESQRVTEIQAGNLVQRVQQIGHWVVAKLEGTDAILKQLHNILECTVPLSDLVLTVIPEERVP